MTKVTRDFTTEVFIVFNKKLLLFKHKKIGLWFPPGWHIEKNELIDESALKEIKEETGLDVELYNPDRLIDNLPRVKGLISPIYVLLENINENHQHIDFIYFAKAHSDSVNPSDGESREYIIKNDDFFCTNN